MQGKRQRNLELSQRTVVGSKEDGEKALLRAGGWHKLRGEAQEGALFFALQRHVAVVDVNLVIGQGPVAAWCQLEKIVKGVGGGRVLTVTLFSEKTHVPWQFTPPPSDTLRRYLLV